MTCNRHGLNDSYKELSCTIIFLVTQFSSGLRACLLGRLVLWVLLKTMLSRITFPPIFSYSQVEACQSEAERIHNLFKMGSPTILSYLTLSPFLLVSLERSSVSHLTGLDPTYQSDAHSRNFDSSDNKSQTLSSHFWVFICFWVLVSVVCNEQRLL